MALNETPIGMPTSNDVFFDQNLYPPVEPMPQGPPAVVDLAPRQPTLYSDPFSQLNAQITLLNIAEGMPEAELVKVATRVIDDFRIDKDSRADWEREFEEVKKIAMLTLEKKTYAGQPVSSVKYPLIMTASIHFSSRAYPEIIKGKDVVKCAVIGKDETGNKQGMADRVSRHMSYQLLHEMDWEQELDQLLTSLPILGVMFKKTYRCGLDDKNVSELVFPDNLVVHYWAKDIDTAARVTHVIELTKNEIVERINAGVFLPIDMDRVGSPDPMAVDPDRAGADAHNNTDEDAPHIFLEQHRWLDLDNDGYQEPYIVTVHYKSQQVVRIAARYDTDGVKADEKGNIVKITPVSYFTRFIFMPAADGNFYGMGFGKLLFGINQAVNTILNQLIDAGTAANRQCGFIGRGLQIGRSSGGMDGLKLASGEWKAVPSVGDDIRKNIVPLPTKEPSQVLFTLLNFLVDAGKELSSVSDVMSGESPGPNVPAASTLAVIEQGLKVFSGIFKRLYRSLKDEFRKIRRLNRMYLPDAHYYAVLDDEAAVFQMDYADDTMDIVPIADPDSASDMMRSLKAEALLKMIGQGLNDMEIRKRYLQSLNIDGIEKILPPEDAPPPTDPKVDAEVNLLNARAEREKANFQLIAEKANTERVKQTVQIKGIELDDKKLKIETARTISDIDTAKKNAKIGAATAIAKVNASQMKGKSANKKEQGVYIEKGMKSNNKAE